MTENARLSRFRFRLGTVLLAVAIVALLLMVFIQQVQIGRMRQVIDQGAKEKDQLTKIIRELRNYLERQK